MGGLVIYLRLTLEVSWFNTLRPGQNGRHFQHDIFKRILLNENVWISIIISLKYVPGGPINNIPALVRKMVWRRPGDQPLSEPMMVSLLSHICVTRPQLVIGDVDIAGCTMKVYIYIYTNIHSYSSKGNIKANITQFNVHDYQHYVQRYIDGSLWPFEDVD